MWSHRLNPQQTERFWLRDIWKEKCVSDAISGGGAIFVRMRCHRFQDLPLQDISGPLVKQIYWDSLTTVYNAQVIRDYDKGKPHSNRSVFQEKVFKRKLIVYWVNLLRQLCIHRVYIVVTNHSTNPSELSRIRKEGADPVPLCTRNQPWGMSKILIIWCRGTGHRGKRAWPSSDWRSAPGERIEFQEVSTLCVAQTQTDPGVSEVSPLDSRKEQLSFLPLFLCGRSNLFIFFLRTRK